MANSAAWLIRSRTSPSIFFSASSLGEFLFKDAMARHVDRIVVCADLIDFFAGAVLRRVRHRVAAIAICKHLENIRTFAGPTPLRRFLACRLHCTHVHSIHLVTRNIERQAAARQVHFGRGAGNCGPHGVTVVLNHINHRQLPELRHVEALIDLTLVGRAVAEIGDGDIFVAAVVIGEGQAGSERNLRADDPVATVEALLHAEHMHGAAFALGISVRASGEFGHHALRIHAGCEHMAVVAIAGDDLVALLERHLHADDYGFLADIEMAKAADQPHAVHLARLLLKAADGQHGTVGGKLLFLAEVDDGFGVGAWNSFGRPPSSLPTKASGNCNGASVGFREPHSLNCPGAKARGRRPELRKTRQNWPKISRRTVDNAAAWIRLLARMQQEGQVVRVHIADQGAGAFVKHVGVDPVGAQQRYPSFP